MAKWSESQIYQKTRGTNRFTRFVGWLNNIFNPNHDWVSDWQQFSDNTGPSEDIINQITKQDLTGAEKAANAFTASEAEKQRQWEADMQNTAYQRQVKDMQAAGINPALAMSNGQPSTPSGAAAQSVSPGSSGMNMSDLMQIMMLPAQRKLINAQAKATEANADKSRAEIGEIEGRTEQLRLINKYYPSVTETTIDKMKSELGLTDEKINTEILQQGLLKADQVLKDAEGKYADRFYKARAEYEEAKDDESRANAAASAARAAWDEFEKSWTESHNGARPSASATLALVSAITSWLGIKEDGTVTGAVAGAIKQKVDEVGGLVDDPVGTIKNKGAQIDQKLDRIRGRWRRFRNWVDKPKKAPWVK